MIDVMPLAPRTRALVGRASELDRVRLSTGLDRRGSGAGGAVLISGDAGIGKSRLVAEVAAEATAADRLVVAGHCVGVGGEGLAWLPFTELVGEIARETPALTQTLEAHPALAGLHSPLASGSTAADPAQVAAGVHALLSAAATERPVLVIIEDVHWADHSSRDLLTLLLTRGFTAPVSLVVTYRSDDLHRRHPLHDVLAVWTHLPLVTRVDLGPLPTVEMHQLVRSLEDAPSATSRVSAVVDRAGGNPFFAEELVAGGDTSATSLDLTRLLRVRLERLDESARLLVRAASLAGRSVDPDLLREVTGLAPDDLDEAFLQAIDHQILEATGRGDFRFRHPLLEETVAAELLPGARRRLHQAWLSVLQDRPESAPPADLARHAAATGDTVTAARAAVEAGDAALHLGGARDALRLYEAALGWIHDDPVRRAEVYLVASTAAKASGDQLRSLDLLEEGLTELSGQDHPRLRARLLVRAAVWYALLDVPGDALAMSQEAVSLLPEWREPEDFDVLMRHLDVLVNQGQSMERSRVVEEIVARAQQLDLPEVVAEARLHEARLLSRVDPERARPGLLTTAEDPDAPGQLRLSALLRLGTLEHNEGDLQRAFGYYLAGVEIAERRHRPWGPYGMECRLQAGRTAYELGRWSEAERLLSSPIDLAHPPRGFMEGCLVELLVARGDDVDPDRLTETIRWWEVDVLLVVATLGGLIDLLGRLDRPAELLDLVQRGTATLDRVWGADAQAVLRLAALFTGQVADLAARGHDVRALRAQSDTYAERVAAMRTREDLRMGPESRAWIVRHDAERLRLTATTGERPDPDALVDAWQRAADSFAALPNVPEQARSLARLAEALVRVGQSAQATAPAGEARALAEDLGARPVLDLLERAVPSGAAPHATPGSLTPREREVLTHLERGRTNGQIADALFISRKTASVHVSNILAKLGAATRGEAVSLARGQGLID